MSISSSGYTFDQKEIDAFGTKGHESLDISKKEGRWTIKSVPTSGFFSRLFVQSETKKVQDTVIQLRAFANTTDVPSIDRAKVLQNVARAFPALKTEAESMVKKLIPELYFEQQIELLGIKAQTKAEQQRELGARYEKGEGVPKNLNRAFELFYEAAEAGEPQAQLKIAHFYEKGICIIPDPANAFKYYQKALTDKNKKAPWYPDQLCQLARCYRDGVGTEQNLKTAYKLYDEARKLGSVEGRFEYAECLQKGLGIEKDVTAAKSQYEEAAKKGNKHAQYALGKICLDSKNEKEANEWFEMAAKQGDPEAQYQLGLSCSNRNDNKKAMGWFKQAADQGHAMAQYKYGLCIKSTVPDTARDYFLKASVQDSLTQKEKLDVKKELMSNYLRGNLAADSFRAYEQYKEIRSQLNEQEKEAFVNEFAACEYGRHWNALTKSQLQDLKEGTYVLQLKEWEKEKIETPEALRERGKCFEQGKGVQQDLKKAFEYYERASGKGDTEAQLALGRFYEFGVEVDPQPAKALELYKKAADAGNAAAQLEFAKRCHRGIGLSISSEGYKPNKETLKTAFEYYTKASHLASAQFEVALFLEEQKDNAAIKFSQDSDKLQMAFKLYEAADKQGYSKATTRLGLCYEKGIGVKQDLDRAFVLYEKAMNAGEPEACLYLAKFYRISNPEYAEELCRKVEKDEKRVQEWLNSLLPESTETEVKSTEAEVKIREEVEGSTDSSTTTTTVEEQIEGLSSNTPITPSAPPPQSML